MERRLQLLLDQHRFELLEQEAKRSGRSVAAIIREAIDLRFDDDDQRRMQAAGRLLERAGARNTGTEQEWSDVKAAFEDEIGERLARSGVE